MSTAQALCEDKSKTVDIGWSYKPRCGQIKRKYPKLCENKNLVKHVCANTCEACDFNPCLSCEDSKGKRCCVLLSQPFILTQIKFFALL